MTVEELNEIRERVEKATEGPWEVGITGESIQVGSKFIAVIADEMTYQFGAGNKEDADFIAQSRADIPNLLAEIEYMNRLTKEFGEIISEFCAGLYGRHNMTTQVADELIDIIAIYERKGLPISGGDSE